MITSYFIISALYYSVILKPLLLSHTVTLFRHSLPLSVIYFKERPNDRFYCFYTTTTLTATTTIIITINNDDDDRLHINCLLSPEVRDYEITYTIKPMYVMYENLGRPKSYEAYIILIGQYLNIRQ